MKRVVFGVVWFVVFFIACNIILGIVMGAIAAHAAGSHAPANYHDSLQAGRVFMQQHAAAIGVWRMVILVVAIVLAAGGAIAGILPGTRKNKAVVPVQ